MDDNSDPSAPARSTADASLDSSDALDPTGDVDAEDDTQADLEESSIIETALARFALAEEAETDMRKQAQDDLEFLSGKQWSLEVLQEREIDRRPCLVVNRLPQQVQQITNDQRQNRPAIKVSPVDSAATEDLAEIIEGLVRHIEYRSNAETAYDTAGEAAVRTGFGYWRILTDFTDPESFDQEIVIKQIKNQFSVFLDPYHQEPDGSDANWGFIIEDLPEEEYKARYPGSKAALASDWSALGNDAPDWVKADSCRVAEYFYKEMKAAKIHLLATGETVHDDQLYQRQVEAYHAGIDAHVVKTRDTKIPVVKWVKMTALEVIEKTEWVGTFIPIIPVYGNEININGKKILEGIIRHAKDPQRMLNYMKSAAAETIGLAPRTPFVVAEGQLEGYTQIWEEANRKNHAYLPYKPTSIAGAQVPPPQRQTFEPAVQAVSQAAMGAADDIKAVTGIYDSALGAQGNETAGVAIDARSRQTQTSNFHFYDNLKRSIRHTGRCLVEIIPKVYDSARAARILKEDGTQKIVKLNQQHTDPDTGKEVLYSLSAGTYDVTVDIGPSFATKRKEAEASMIEFSKALPQQAPFFADLIAANADWNGAQEIAERLRMMLPQQLQANQKQQQLPPQAMQLIQQQHSMINGLQAKLNDADKIIETKKLELEHKERVELWNIQLQEKKLQIEAASDMAKLDTQKAIALLVQEVGALKHESGLANDRLSLLNVGQPIDAPQDFNPQEADGGNYPDAGHVGGSPTGGPSPGQSPGQPPGVNP